MNLVPILAAALAAQAPAPATDVVMARVVLKCTLHEDGSVSPCEVERETPEGQGYGERALELAKRSRYNQAGRPGVVRIPMSFPVIDLSDEPAAPGSRAP